MGFLEALSSFMTTTTLPGHTPEELCGSPPTYHALVSMLTSSICHVIDLLAVEREVEDPDSITTPATGPTEWPGLSYICLNVIHFMNIIRAFLTFASLKFLVFY